MARIVVAPWQIWAVQFTPNVGSEQGGYRPAIIVGSDLHCDMPNRIALGIPCTTTDRPLFHYVPVWRTEDGRQAYAQPDQLRAISLERFAKPYTRAVLTDAMREAITFALGEMLIT